MDWRGKSIGGRLLAASYYENGSVCVEEIAVQPTLFESVVYKNGVDSKGFEALRWIILPHLSCLRELNIV